MDEAIGESKGCMAWGRGDAPDASSRSGNRLLRLRHPLQRSPQRANLSLMLVGRGPR
jgi:hypothetical protein